jgi:hypothetical protein
MRSLTSIELEASVIQQSVQWWVAKENVAQFQAQLKDCTDDIRRPMIEWLLDQELAKLSALPNVMPRFSRIAASSPETSTLSLQHTQTAHESQRAHTNGVCSTPQPGA